MTDLPKKTAKTPAKLSKKILLVEDDNSLALMYQNRFSAEGFQIRRVADGEHALAEALSFRPDLILLDIMMPKITGFDVLDILRNTPETANIKVVMLTARGQDNDRNQASYLGADDYLIKSQVVMTDVVARVKKQLS